MTTLLLVRHAHSDHVGRRLVGRAAGVRLSEQGTCEAEALAARLASVALSAVYASPLERAEQTARALAAPHGLEIRTVEELVELDYGDWTGLTMDEVRERPEWRSYSGSRSTAAPPNGEGLAAVQERALRAMRRIATAHPDGTVAAVSHGDVIRSLVAHVARIPLDAIDRFEVLPASVSIVEFGVGWERLRSLNSGVLPG